MRAVLTMSGTRCTAICSAAAVAVVVVDGRRRRGTVRCCRFRRATYHCMVAVMAGIREMVSMGASAQSISVLLARDVHTREDAARLAADADPSSAFGAAVREVFTEIANGERVIILRPDREVTPAGAADLLGVSRQFVDRLLADGSLAFRRLPGSSHRRIKIGDVVELADERERRRSGAAAIRAVLDPRQG